MHILEPSPKAAAGFASQSPGAVSAVPTHNANDPRWQLALRITASKSLGRSQLLSDFLLYIVDRSIQGRTHLITEQQIGVLVFGRTEDYDSNDDNIVRSYARKLRKRIDDYFATEGCEETLRIEIPRGGYAPIFSEQLIPQSEVKDPADDSPTIALLDATDTLQPSPDPIEVTPPATLNSRLTIAGTLAPATIVALFVGLVIGVGAAVLLSTRPLLSQEEATSHSLWKQLFSKDRDTFIVPSDDGLVIMQRLIERPLPLTSYINGSYRSFAKTDTPGAPEILKLSSRRFTSVADLDFATHLAQLKEVVPGRMMIRYARDLRMDDLRSGNAILIGSDESDPWIELFRSQLHFRFQFEPDPDKPSGFVNLYPRAGEAQIYTTKGQEEQTYGIIAYLPNLTNNGHVLIIAGLNTAGTQAAAAFLLDPSSMMQPLKQARTPHGDLQPFELLVGAGNVATNASTPHIILERFGLPPRG
jgi:hypothetical protein